MNQLPYTFHGNAKPLRYAVYRKEDLERMTLLQLRDICERERIIHAAMDKMDREELIHLVLCFRGSRTPKLIREEKEEGCKRLENALSKSEIGFLQHKISMPAKISVYQGLETNWADGYSLPYDPDLDGVNALIIDNQGGICCVMNIESYENVEKLYLTRQAELSCREAPVHDYKMYLFPQKLSDVVWSVYMGKSDSLPPQIRLYCVPLRGFFVRSPVEITMPLAIDFGTSNTVAGIYIDNVFYSKISDGVQTGQLKPNAVNYVEYLSSSGDRIPILPSAISVEQISGEQVAYSIGFEAEKMVESGYLGEGLGVFYDIKRWVSSYNDQEELVDYQGNSAVVQRKDIVKAYLQYIISCAEQRFKCKIINVYLPYPVKQKERFMALYREILPDYHISSNQTLDEGVSVIYNTIAGMIDERKYEEGAWYKALIIDCGGGTTDLSSCDFSIKDERVSYNITIETAYENGDTDFGGNNLTYRILQMIKIAAAYALRGSGESVESVTANMDVDLYRLIDQKGKEGIYEKLEKAYAEAENIIPTRFKDYEYRSKDEYFMVKNNYYVLFSLAEKAKMLFFSYYQLLRVIVGSAPVQLGDPYMMHLAAPRWKLATIQKGKLTIQKNFPTVVLNTAIVKMVLKADIYDIIHRFLAPLYDGGELSEYNIIKLTGQSCRINMFRDCIKEYIPGCLLQERPGYAPENFELKLCCLNGAIRYISDKRLGYARVNISSKTPALPYVLSAYTHNGEKVILVHSLDRNRIYGSISRNLESVELRLYLANTQGEEKYVYSIYCNPSTFKDVTYEEIEALYKEQIPQDAVDIIENGEVRYFIWAENWQWGFSVVPVLRDNEQLRIGAQQIFQFENDQWIVNYFDGTR